MTMHTLVAPATPAAAIAFALTNLEEFEVAPFLMDYQEGKPLEQWVEGLEEDQQFAAWAAEDDHRAVSKYDWSQFTAPGQSAEMPATSLNSIYVSIKRYRERLRAYGVRALPEFTIVRNTNPETGKVESCRIFRIK